MGKDTGESVGFDEANGLCSLIKAAGKPALDRVCARMERHLKEDRLYIAAYCPSYWDYSAYREDYREITVHELEDFYENLSWVSGELYFDFGEYKGLSFADVLLSVVLLEPSLPAHLKDDPDALTGLILTCVDPQLARQAFKEAFPFKEAARLIRENPHYREVFLRADEEERRSAFITGEILKEMPGDIPGLYPLARQMKRHFILHVGGTNSGKTREALECLKKAGGGVYLAPLRLMAYEAFECLNKMGAPCAMKTGEEEICIPGAAFVSMTIELFDTGRVFSLVVVDEGQLLTDPQRGGAWTEAILGAAAKQIHVCMAPEAEALIIRLVTLCGDTYEVRRHERKTPLVPETERFHFPDSVSQGDALIVFGKYKAIAVARALKEKGFKCSLVYGALPYEVRRREVRRFARGFNEVLVATDAIGMGMNIPIRRVVFLETSKFDGKERRPLTGAQIRQIAGRAGRYGLYDTGYFTALGDVPAVIEKYMSPPAPPERAVLSFPERLLSIPGRLSDLILRWKDIVPGELFEKADINLQLALVRRCEAVTEDRRLAYEFSRLPADLQDGPVMALYQALLETVASGKRLCIYDFFDFSAPLPRTQDALESLYTQLDLLYCCMGRFGPLESRKEERARILARKKLIADKIAALLADGCYEGRLRRVTSRFHAQGRKKV